MNFILKITFFITFLYISNFITKVSLGNIVVISYENTTNEKFDIGMFKEHIKILKQDKYYILSTNNIINAMLSTKILPNYSVAITVASNKIQIINTVWPILAKQSLPFTLFIEPNLIGNKKNMSWNDINILHNNGVEIGIKGTPNNIKNSINLFKNNMSTKPSSYLYKLGIWSDKEIKILKENDIKIAFGDNSGPVSFKMNMYKLPRFNISGKFSNIKRLKTVLNSLPLEVSDVLPLNNTLNNNPPLYGFTLLNKNHKPNCYTNNNDKVEVIVLNETRIEVRSKKFTGSKARINCISLDSNNRLLWHGSLYWVHK